MFRRLLRWLPAAAVVAVAIAYLAIATAGDDPAHWHRDPAAIHLRGLPNEYLAAPPGTTALRPHAATRIYPESPRELLARFDAVARARPRTRVVAGSVDSLMITYVQRSRLMRFPDYVTVKAVAAADGAGLIVYSRSRYGRGDFGVNRARVEAWLAALDRPG